MTSIKEIIEIALNDGYAVKRYRVDSVVLKESVYEVHCFDTLLSRDDVFKFSS